MTNKHFSIKEICNKYIFCFKLILVILISIFIIGAFYIQKTDTLNTIEPFGENTEGSISELIRNNDVFVQEFPVLTNKQEKIQNIQILCATYSSTITGGKVKVEILSANNQIVYETNLSATQISDNSYFIIPIDSDIDFGDDLYKLRLTFSEIEDQKIAFWLSDSNRYNDYSLSINGTKSVSDLLLKQEQTTNVVNRFYLYIMFACVFMIGCVFYFVYKKKLVIHKLYLFTSVILGAIFLILIPVYVVPDEPAHIYTAYSRSNSLLGINNTDNNTLRMRYDDSYCDLQTLRTTQIDRQYLSTYIHGLDNIFIENAEMVDTNQTILDTPFYLHLFSGIGITIGRLLDLSTVWTYLLGRLFNLSLFIFSVYYGLKKLPFGRCALFIWSILPMTLQQAASFSYDSIIFSLATLVVCLSLKMAYDSSKIKVIEWIILCISALLLLPVKSFALSPLCILPVLIFFNKYKGNRKKIYVFAGVCLGIVAIVLLYKISYIYINYADMPSNWIGWANEEGYNLGELLNEPKRMISLIYKTIFDKGQWYVETSLGSSLGWFELSIPGVVIYPYGVMLLVAGLKKNGEITFLETRARIFIILICIIGIGFACAGMLLGWTPKSYSSIEGVQGRYFLPYMVVGILTLRNSHIVIDEHIERAIIFASIWLEMFVLISLFRTMGVVG